MPRRRLGVALVLDPPVADEIDGLRRALGDRARTRIPPHLTLISPVNVRQDHVGPALELLRETAASAPGPLRLVLGPPQTFLPDNPVLYLAVSGDDLPVLTRMRAITFRPPLARPLTWPWVPHVTLADNLVVDRIATAATALHDYLVTTTCDRLVLLEERPRSPESNPGGRGAIEEEGGAPRRWEPLADACLGPRVIIGRGGLALELTMGRVVDPQAAAVASEVAAESEAGPTPGAPEVGEVGVLAQVEAGPAPFPLICTARRDGEVVGVAGAWQTRGRGVLAVVVPGSHRGQGIGTHLLARVESTLFAAGWDGPPLQPWGPPAFFRDRSRTARPIGTAGVKTED